MRKCNRIVLNDRKKIVNFMKLHKNFYVKFFFTRNDFILAAKFIIFIIFITVREYIWQFLVLK